MTEAQPAYRRFNVGDAAIVVLGLAPTLVIARAAIPGFAAMLHPPAGAATSFGMQLAGGTVVKVSSRTLMVVIGAGLMLQALLATWLLVFALLRLRRPRPPLRVVALQPGMMTVWALVIPIVVSLLLSPVIRGTAYDVITVAVACLALPGLWMALVLTRKWRSEPTWIDRLGRALGFVWWALTWANVVLILVARAKH